MHYKVGDVVRIKRNTLNSTFIISKINGENVDLRGRYSINEISNPPKTKSKLFT